MRLAYFSPMPPARSGIADYSAALVSELGQLVDLTVFDRRAEPFRGSRFDIAVYQIGNNGWHDFVYEQALAEPGVVVLHEANLHHLIADITIKRGDWDAYLREAEYEGGPEALAYAKRVQALEVGPDYDGLPMLRRLLDRARGVIVHSSAVEADGRKAGYRRPVAVVPHGAWLPEGDRMGYRARLGLNHATPLVGIFGFLKPYKRIAESLRAFRRLVRVQPDAKLILVGEPHPDLPLLPMIRSLDLQASVRILGFTEIDDFVGYLSACDIILNLRYPTVGESSGTLLRSLGLGKAVLVSGVGSFREYPDRICLKVPVDAAEEETIFEFLNLLVSRPDLRQELGANAREWVARECNWKRVAGLYAGFLESVVAGKEWTVPAAATETPAAPVLRAEDAEPYVRSWAGGEQGRVYIDTHLTRLAHTLEITPPGGPEDRVLEMGAYLQITPALQTKLGYGEVRGCYYGPAGRIERKRVTSRDGEVFECDVDLFDAERDPYPYPDGHFATVLCCELIEHLPADPMHMMAEINRVLKPGGHLVLTTPNIVSVRALAAILQGYHPGFFPAYILPARNGEEVDARHNREYAPREIADLFRDAGFEVRRLETGPFREEPRPEHRWVEHLLRAYELSAELRGDGIYAVGVKQGPVRDRYPAWLYSGGA